MDRGDRRELDGRRHALGDAGASIVEFALIVPLLVLLLCGIIEVGWLFAQNLDVRHGAREGARLAAVDGLTDAADICARMDTANSSGTLISAARDGDEIGSDVTVTIAAPAETITGVLDWAFPSSMRLESTAVVRLEQEPTWPEMSSVACP